MNREERRKLGIKKELNVLSGQTQIQKWFDSWSPQQMSFHKELVHKIVKESEERTELILDSCYIGAMLQYTEIELSQCIEISKLANENMEETSQYLNKERKYYNMINDEKLRSKIREEAKIMQSKGIKIAPGIKELRKTYDFPQKDIHIIWAEGKEEIAADQELKEIIKKHIPKEQIPYVVTEKEIEEAKEWDNKVLNNKHELVPIKRGLTITSTGITANGSLKESKLKILEQTIKGEYGTYIKSSEGVKTEKISVKDIKDLETYKNMVEADYNKGREELNKKLREIQAEIVNLDMRADKNFSIIEEIKQVFQM